MVARMVASILFLSSRQVLNLVEQPANSLMEWSPWFNMLMVLLSWHCKHTWLGMFNHFLKKPTQLYSPCRQILRKLHRKLDSNLSYLWDSSEGVQFLDPQPGMRNRVNGLQRLRDSQAYTPEFASEVFAAWMEHQNDTDLPDDASSVSDEEHERMSATWDWQYAEFGEVTAALGMQEHTLH